MREVTFTDFDGRKWRRLIPDEAPDEQAEYGIPVGPPPLDRLRLPLALEIRLHNELFNRGLFTERDVRRRSEELPSALRSAIGLDVQKIFECYALAAPDAALTAEPPHT